ncbi:hypothetical protein QE441_000443 [Chryseobacterium sp. SORGH_AS909]|uniref:Uncharacterized protein n=1 Tax=Chryseobacterium camelliae TaxID=1265445 RepID=A0ABU0TJQ4_9FLAO|nr:hypothetical protein [Chryseobacterium camelliae]MDQ1101203.1 hypothetical protein [Chryseobacterium sp. SORGH_AS_1048]MDR6084649.1 hypothetical protein [Chryseobacterium sp. SORGH_AS_0909]MDR6132921.1 hypothetical protein [Chryseobacterium sp. SORGH_AS_1175]MDT3408874.1 hypothetical protein [Pseudacidovorax intermedius]
MILTKEHEKAGSGDEPANQKNEYTLKIKIESGKYIPPILAEL